jgi:Bax protein
MKVSIWFSLMMFLLVIAGLLAPFTFLKPQKPLINVGISVETPVVPFKEEVVVKVEQPLHKVVIPDFAAIYDVKQKKRQFFEFIYPAIVKENARLLALRDEILVMFEVVYLHKQLSLEQVKQLKALKHYYKVNSKLALLDQIQALYLKVDIVPYELVLAQAANESAWGTSRFAKIGLNFFGMWCYRKGCGMVPGGRDTGAKHEVAKFNSVDHAVRRYLYNINTHYAYDVFRVIRGQLRSHAQELSPKILATGLLRYSIRGSDYVVEISDMLRHNQRYFDELSNKNIIAM